MKFLPVKKLDLGLDKSFKIVPASLFENGIDLTYLNIDISASYFERRLMSFDATSFYQQTDYYSETLKRIRSIKSTSRF